MRPLLILAVVGLTAARQRLPKDMNPNDDVEILSRPAAPVIKTMPPLPKDVHGTPITNLTVYLVSNTRPRRTSHAPLLLTYAQLANPFSTWLNGPSREKVAAQFDLEESGFQRGCPC